MFSFGEKLFVSAMVVSFGSVMVGLAPELASAVRAGLMYGGLIGFILVCGVAGLVQSRN